MEVSSLRARFGRTVLGLFGAAGVALGAVGALGVHGTGPRFLAALGGLGLITHGVGLLRIARKGGGPSAPDSLRAPRVTLSISQAIVFWALLVLAAIAIVRFSSTSR